MPDRNFANRTLYHGDNLDFLRGMNSGTVNLIATDPPFNKSRDFHATPDSLARGASFQDRWSWQDDIHDDWLDQIQGDEPEVWQVVNSAKQVWGDDMGAFLCWLGVRLLEMHRILADDGSIYLHCDATAGAYIKQLMDSVFGVSNFKNEVTWERTRGRSDGRHWGNTTDTILFYTKSSNYVWHNVYQERISEAESTLGDLTAAETRNGISGESWQGYNPTDFGRHWAVPRSNRLAEWIEENRIPGYLQIENPHARLDALNDAGMIAWSENGRPAIIRPAEASAGAKVNNLWADITRVAGQERTGYPTQKPLALYERIIQASSNPGDMVLDPFCGCATTPVGAERLGRQWVGMDIWDEAHQMILDRLEAEGLAVKDRPRRQGQQQLLTFGDITYSTTPPQRTDGGETAAEAFRTPTRSNGQRYPSPRTQHGKLLVDIGPFCQGCGADYGFDTRVLEVDHINPRSQGGTDAYENLTLLCPPCNKEKRDRFTLIGLQAHNRANGYMRNENNLRMGRAAGRSGRRRR